MHFVLIRVHHINTKQRGPNRSVILQGDELEDAQSDAAEHHEAVTRQPGL
jgi:hypothetical protein